MKTQAIKHVEREPGEILVNTRFLGIIPRRKTVYIKKVEDPVRQIELYNEGLSLLVGENIRDYDFYYSSSYTDFGCFIDECFKARGKIKNEKIINTFTFWNSFGERRDKKELRERLAREYSENGSRISGPVEKVIAFQGIVPRVFYKLSITDFCSFPTKESYEKCAR